MLKVIRVLVRFAPLPIFFGLSVVNYYSEVMGGHSHHDVSGMSMSGHMQLGVMPILTSMWLMYLVMGLAHAGPWLGRKRG